jgi:hypothetical protein
MGNLVETTANSSRTLRDEVLNQSSDGRDCKEDAATNDTGHVRPASLVFERGRDKASGGNHRADYVAHPVDYIENRTLNLGSLLALNRFADRWRRA